jgi:hypothetical protein
VLPKNLTHNVIDHIKRVKHGLAERAIAYLMTEAAGQSYAILETSSGVICRSSMRITTAPKLGLQAF